MTHSHSHSQLHSHQHSHFGSHPTGSILAIVFWINFAFMLVEAVGGWLTNSLALLADAGHMVNDVLSLGLAWGAHRLASLKSVGTYTYGYRRAQVLAALFNAASLGAIVVFIIMEAIRRFGSPQPILAGEMLLIASAGFIANLVSGVLLFSRRDESLNIRGAFLHLMADTLGSVAAVGAAIVIKSTGWLPVDPILSVVIALLMSASAWGLIRDSISVLMERAPTGFPTAGLAAALEQVDGVEAIHDLHVWQLDDGKPLATVHIVVDRIHREDHQSILVACHRIFRERFNVDHATIQIEGRDWSLCVTDCHAS